MCLGNALQALGAHRPGMVELEEAIATFRGALQEYTRERAPLAFAAAAGHQGVALMRLAGRRGDEAMAKLALEGIKAALAVSQNSGDAALIIYLKAYLAEANAIADSLARR